MQSDALRTAGPVGVARPELVARLRSTDATTLIVAAAGYGKTRLLRLWEAQDPRPFVWLSSAELVARDHDASGSIAEVLVIDDLDRSRSADPEFQRAVRAVILQPETRVVLAGRSLDPGLTTGLRLDADVVELDEEDLAFDDTAARALLASRCDDSEIAVLVDRTEGWPAALRLAAVAIDEGADPSSFTGRDRTVTEYLASAVFRDVDADSLAFLQACSVFDTLDAALCDVVLERRDSASMLWALEDAHLFVRSLDRERERFSIHPLVRESLQAQLDRSDPGAASALRDRGAAWLSRSGRSREALIVRLRNGDPAGAAELLADVVLPMFSSGDLVALVEFIHRIGPDVAVHNGFLATMFAYAGVMTGDSVCAERWCLTARRFYAAHRFATPDEEAAYFTMRAHLAPDGVTVMAGDARRAADIAGEASSWRIPALMLAGSAEILRGDETAARPLLDEAVHRSAETGIRPALVLSLAQRAALSMDDTRSSRARDDLRAAEEAIAEDMRAYPHAAMVWALTALCRQRDGDVRGARSAFHAAMALRPVAGRTMPWLGVQVRTALARAAVALGSVDTARALLSEARLLLAVLPDATALHRDVAAVEEAAAPLGPRPEAAPLLSAAELRVLPFLSTHLSFEEIGAQLFVSRHTIRSQAKSIYRKLGVASRSAAVQHARTLGLVTG